MNVPMPLTCQRCNGPMPDLPDELGKLLASGASVELVHATCPGDEAVAEPEGRYFEVRCSIVEVTEAPADDDHPLADAEPTVTATELASFVAGVRAADLEAAMRPLAEALGERWMRVEKHARLADPATPPRG